MEKTYKLILHRLNWFHSNLKKQIYLPKRLHIDYQAKDADAGLRQIENFVFQNEFGNSISVYDYDQDTTASTKIGKTQLVGEYQLKVYSYMIAHIAQIELNIRMTAPPKSTTM